MGVAIAGRRGPGKDVLGYVGQPADLGIEQGHVDGLTAAGALAVVQRGQDGRGGE